MRLLHLTDFHHGNPSLAPQDPAAPALKRSLPVRERLKLCKERLTRCPPEALILSGDFAMNGNPADIRQIMQEIRSCFPGLPVAFVPGNHDHPAEASINHTDLFDVSPFCRVFPLQKLYAICLDTSRPGSDRGIIDNAQCQWLKETLAELQGQPAILITHFHLLPGQHAMPCASYPDEFTEIIAQSSLSAVFTGHTHCHYQGFFAGKPYCTAPGFSFYGLPSASNTIALEPCFGYNLYTIQQGRFTGIRTETFYESM